MLDFINETASLPLAMRFSNKFLKLNECCHSVACIYMVEIK